MLHSRARIAAMHVGREIARKSFTSTHNASPRVLRGKARALSLERRPVMADAGMVLAGAFFIAPFFCFLPVRLGEHRYIKARKSYATHTVSHFAGNHHRFANSVTHGGYLCG